MRFMLIFYYVTLQVLFTKACRMYQCGRGCCKVGGECSENELICMSQELSKTAELSKIKKRSTYSESDKRRIAMYATQNGNTNVVRKFRNDFPKLTESTLRPWVQKYKSEMKNSPEGTQIVIGVKRGRPILLLSELDCKLRTLLTNGFGKI